MRASSLGGTAPVRVSTLSPALKAMKVGMARMPTSWLASPTLSTSTEANLMPAKSAESESLDTHESQHGAARRGAGWMDGTYFSKMGEMALQGPHQVALKSTMTLSFPLMRVLNSSKLGGS